VGEQLELNDHAGRQRGVVVTTKVRILPLDQVGDDVARDEGEGFEDATDWRRAHEAFWSTLVEQIRNDAGDPDWELRPAEPVVVEWFRAQRQDSHGAE
jgi:uncharacterized protein YhfF